MVYRNGLRFTLKNDTEEKWEQNKDFVPLRGEPIVVFDQFGNARMKIGDGTRNYGELGFIDGITFAPLPASENTPVDDVDENEYMRVAFGG